MRKLVSVYVFTLGGGYIAYGIGHKINVFVKSETYLLEVPKGWFKKYHMLFSNYGSGHKLLFQVTPCSTCMFFRV